MQLSTNITTYNERQLNILTKYKSVNISLSVDSHIPKQLAYIRYPCDPAQIIENLQKFRNYFANHQNVSLSITLTVTPHNIYYLDEIHDALCKYMPFNEFNFVHIPAKYDVRIIPHPIKIAISEKINKPEIKEYLLQEVSGAKDLFREFWNETLDLDSYRNQNFQSVFPEYYEILKPYLP